MKILVTGASGFAGNAIARELVAGGHEVWGVTRQKTTTKSLANPPTGLRIIQADLLREWGFSIPDSSPSLADPAVDCVVHAAAVLPHEGYDQSQLVCGNQAMMTQLVEWAKRNGASKIVYLSSLAVYGVQPDRAKAASTIDSSTPTAADTPYARGKLAAEEVLAKITPLAKSGGAISGVSIRLPAVVGLGSHHNFPSNALANVRAGRRISITNPDSLYNHIVHIRELCHFVRHLVEQPIPHYACCVLGAAAPITIRQFAEELLEHSGLRVPIVEQVAERPCPLIDYRSAETLGYVASPVQDIVKRFVTASIAD